MGSQIQKTGGYSGGGDKGVQTIVYKLQGYIVQGNIANIL